MTLEKIKAVAEAHAQMLSNHGTRVRMMGDSEPFSDDPNIARSQMLGHAYHLCLHSIPGLLRDTQKMADAVSREEHHGKIGRHLGSAQTLLWMGGLCTLSQLKNMNRPNTG